jgi:hypothetical protein
MRTDSTFGGGWQAKSGAAGLRGTMASSFAHVQAKAHLTLVLGAKLKQNGRTAGFPSPATMTTRASVEGQNCVNG